MTVHMSLRVTGEKFIHLHQLARWPLEWRQVRKTGWHNSPGYGVWIYNSSFLFVVYNDFFCESRGRVLIASAGNAQCSHSLLIYAVKLLLSSTLDSSLSSREKANERGAHFLLAQLSWWFFISVIALPACDVTPSNRSCELCVPGGQSQATYCAAIYRI